MRVSITPVAKINLRLRVLAREDSGYHSLETIFCAISLHDRLEISYAEDGIDLVVTGSIPVGPPENNLVRRAAIAFHHALGVSPAIAIRLEKAIPAAAGLGGGSSDAAATLRALNLLHDSPFDDRKLLELGGSLGSDVPFFLGHSPFALAWNRGDRLFQLTPPPSRPVLVVDAGIQLPTASAFAALDENRAGLAATTNPISFDPNTFSTWESLAAIARNDFELVAPDWIRGFDHFRGLLRDHGAVIAMLSGSGSALFGVFETAAAMRDCQRSFAAIGVATRLASTIERWPAPFSRD